MIKQGTHIWVPTYAIHRDADYFAKPNDFNPENFSTEAVKNRPSNAFLAFGDGPRNCVGLRFANLQSKIGIVSVIENFRVKVSSKTMLPIELDLKQPVSPSAKGGLWINFEKL